MRDIVETIYGFKGGIRIGRTIRDSGLKFMVYLYPVIYDLLAQIMTCQMAKHIQQVAFSTYHNAFTQICFTCKTLRSTMKEVDSL